MFFDLIVVVFLPFYINSTYPNVVTTTSCVAIDLYVLMICLCF